MMEQKRQLRILSKTWETDDTATFTLEAADGKPFSYQPGQYLTLIFERNGKEKRRAYSFSSCPGVDEFPAVTVKRVVNGEFSNWLLRHAEPGDTLTTTEANGRFLLPEKQPDTIFYIAAGSGITPVMSHLKAMLSTPPPTPPPNERGGATTSRSTLRLPSHLGEGSGVGSNRRNPRIILYYANRDSRSAIFKKQIDQWMIESPGRFECLYFFSQEKNAAHSLFRHLSNELLEQLLFQHFSSGITPQVRRKTLFYLCAPKALMRMAEMTLRTLDFPEKNILKETFVPETQLPTREIDFSKTHDIVALGKNERIEFQTFEGETILNAALRQGIALPYTCKSGVCFTCLAKCVKGEVDVAFVDSTKREGAGQMVNTCIGYAVTGKVKLLYE
jgi:ring-1,2-phenylacetyl-CoA epoxidase subunit PaaE